MQGILILLGIIAIGLFGGSKGAQNNGLLSSGARTPEQKQANLEYQIIDTQNKINTLKQEQALEEEKRNASIYKGIIDVSSINHSDDPTQEYLVIRNTGNPNQKIPITGWTLKSLSSGVSVTIPKGTELFFTGIINSEENIYLAGGETLYLITGLSPVGYSFKVNKCSGYMGQFQTYTPYLYTMCPAPKNENLSSIPRTVSNDACFDYIDRLPTCKAVTETLPTELGYECRKFIQEKINYSSCINTHKGDVDFLQKEWRVYLKRNAKLWKVQREAIVLYDENSKVVDTLKY